MAPRTRKPRGAGRPSRFVYVVLAAVLIGSFFPFYW